MVNVGGGGLGLLLDAETAGALDGQRLFWIRFGLRGPQGPRIGVAGRVVHTHIDSQSNVYAGVSFEFAGGTDHRHFVLEQILSHVEASQRDQLRRSRSAA